MRAPGPSSRLAAVALVLLGAGCSSAPSRVAGRGAAADPSPGQVLDRPWPERVAATESWTASLRGVGPRFTLTTGGTIVGGLHRTTLDLGGSDRGLVLPTGERWYPQGPFQVEEEGDLPFALVRETHDTGGAYALSALGRDVAATVRFTDVVRAGGGDLRLTGEFVGPDGAEAGELVVPTGTGLAAACKDPSAPTTTSAGRLPPTCHPDTEGVLSATVEADEGLTVRSDGDGEVALAGESGVTAKAFGRKWDGLVVAVEGMSVEATATFDGRQWSVTAAASDGLQVWVDVWPVVDTLLDARSYSVAPGFFDRNRLLKVEWVNVGAATAQILEAVGDGPGASGVGFDLNKTLGHDAGLGVRRGDVVSGFGGGGDVDSNLGPGGTTNRELSYAAGQPATLVLRGNFPEVRIDLAVPGP